MRKSSPAHAAAGCHRHKSPGLSQARARTNRHGHTRPCRTWRSAKTVSEGSRPQMNFTLGLHGPRTRRATWTGLSRATAPRTPRTRRSSPAPRRARRPHRPPPPPQPPSAAPQSLAPHLQSAQSATPLLFSPSLVHTNGTHTRQQGWGVPSFAASPSFCAAGFSAGCSPPANQNQNHSQMKARRRFVQS
eukprot:COSAG04_NODE_4119_length_2286_cov_1.687700_4_plen_189_part_00